MPLYEYECRKCHHRFEVIQGLRQRPIKKCPKCGSGKVEKLISTPAVHFKGTGWYVTDYARKGGGKEAAGGGKEAGEGGKESKDTKSGGDAGGKSEKSDKADKPSGKPGGRKDS